MKLNESILKNLNEIDHETRHEDYTNASREFDDIFLDGDYIYSDNGHCITYRIYDNGNIHQINVSNPYDLNEDYYFAQSKDSYNWKIFGKRNVYPYKDKVNCPIEDRQGEPIEIARYIGKLNDNIDVIIDKS